MTSIKSRAAGKLDVEIEPILTPSGGRPAIRITFEHPKHGPCFADCERWGSMQGKDGASGDYHRADTGRYLGPCCLTIPREDFDRGMDLAQQFHAEAAAAAAQAACPAGFVPCRQVWSNGDMMSACYRTEDGIEVIASDLIENHGVWYYLPVADVEEARAKAQTAQEKKSAAKAEHAAKVAQAKAQATESGEPVEIERWTEDCDGTADECNLDLCVRLALPDGGERVTRTHAH